MCFFYDMTDIIQDNSFDEWQKKYGEELRAQCTAWAELQKERIEREKHEREEDMIAKKKAEEAWLKVENFDLIDQERVEAVKQLDTLNRKHEELKEKNDLWQKTVKLAVEDCKKMEIKVKRRQIAQLHKGEIDLGLPMASHRMWELTGNSNAAAVIRHQSLSGIDIMDFTIDDAKSIKEVDDIDVFMADIIKLRDHITRPVAELVAILRERDDTNENWHEAQVLLKAMFARNLNCN